MTKKRIKSGMKDLSLSSIDTWKQIHTRLIYKRRINKGKLYDKRDREYTVIKQFVVFLTAVTGKVQFLFFRNLSLVLTNFSF